MLRSLHVTHAMADCLGLHGGSGGDHDGAAARAAPVWFRSALILRDTDGRDWPVVYEGSISCKQYHRRMSHGWSAFCQANGVRVSDVVEFRRRPSRDDDTIAVRVLRRADP